MNLGKSLLNYKSERTTATTDLGNWLNGKLGLYLEGFTSPVRPVN
jgi:hypothetical protein